MSDDLGMLERARRYHALGLSPFPLDAGSKEPAHTVLPRGADGKPTWAPFMTKQPTDEQLVAWFGTGVRRNLAVSTRGLFVVVDGDTPTALAWMRANLPPTAIRTRTARGEHWYYRRPRNVTPPAEIRIGDDATIELKRDGQYLVAPGSVHPTGAVYEEVEPWPSDWTGVPVLPENVVGGGTRSAGEPLPDLIRSGDRHMTLFRKACALRRIGLDESEILTTLTELNQNRCDSPLPQRELEGIARSAARYEPERASFPLTEAGDAAFFAVQYANDVRFDHLRDRWLVLDERSGIWLPDVDGQITRLALDTMRVRQQLALTVQESDRRKRAADWAFKGESLATAPTACPWLPCRSGSVPVPTPSRTAA